MKEKKETKLQFLKIIILDIISKFFLIYFISLIGKVFFNDLYSAIFKIHTWIIIAVILIFSGYFKYRRLIEIDDDFALINKVQKSEHPDVENEKYALYKRVYTDIAEKKIDILKSLSPQAILLFVAGIYIDNKSMLNENIEILSKNFVIRDILQYLALSLMVFYSYYFVKCFKEYKRNYLSYACFRSEAILQKKKVNN